MKLLVKQDKMKQTVELFLLLIKKRINKASRIKAKRETETPTPIPTACPF